MSRKETFAENDAYRDRMEVAVRGVVSTLSEAGVSSPPETDSEFVELMTRKFLMLREMVLATGMSPALLAACMKG